MTQHEFRAVLDAFISGLDLEQGPLRQNSRTSSAPSSAPPRRRRRQRHRGAAPRAGRSRHRARRRGDRARPHLRRDHQRGALLRRHAGDRRRRSPDLVHEPRGRRARLHGAAQRRSSRSISTAGRPRSGRSPTSPAAAASPWSRIAPRRTARAIAASAVGQFGDVSCFSFYANKIVTTGEGGMCVTDSPELASSLRVLRDHGMSPDRSYWHERVGFNYRITNLQAAIGQVAALAHRRGAAAQRPDRRVLPRGAGRDPGRALPAAAARRVPRPSCG